MNRTHVLHSLIILLFLSSATVLCNLPYVSKYSLKMQFYLKEQRLSAVAQMTVTNTTGKPVSELPFLLYRLLNVTSVAAAGDIPLQFTQDITSLSDEPTLQTNAITVHLPSPLEPEQSMTLTMTYVGSIFGYPEVMAYVRDRIDEEYALVRPDAIAYPMLAEPSYQSYSNAQDGNYTYRCEVAVPEGYVVACGGKLTNVERLNDTTTFVYESKIPAWRMDIAAAKFVILKDEPRKLFMYALPADSAGAVRVLKGMRDVIAFYSTVFGTVPNYQGYTAIEIPDGWGSQAGDYYFLQTSAAFTDSTRLHEVYHEIGHTWNVKPKPEIQRCRYFDEAFASYFEALAVKEFEGYDAFLSQMQKSRELFIRWANYDKQYSETPIVEYGKHELGRISYTKGAWSLYVLHTLTGDDVFYSTIRKLLSDFEHHEADFKDFQTVTEQTSKLNLSKYFNEWFYGNESSRLLLENVPVDEMMKRYR
ncbi:MAG: hypothetical protein EPO24_15655 [Bacteroidetes bacterium]|nr:MAG: hypothetical protein EPO24_15655 [Bacteroidota bacterium]